MPDASHHDSIRGENRFAYVVGLLASLVLMTGVARADTAPGGGASTSIAEQINPADLGVEAVLVLHYHRPDGDYNNWNVWAWTEGGEGKAFPFDRETDFGRVAIIPADHQTQRFGFIVRRGNWEVKDIDHDRFVNTPAPGNATGNGKGQDVFEAWITAGDPTVYTDPEKIDLSPRLAAAFLDAPSRLAVVSVTNLRNRDIRDAKLETAVGDIKLKNLRRSDTPSPGSIVYDVQLQTPITAEALTSPMTLVVPGFDPQPVYARQILDDPQYVVPDADLGPVCTPEQTAFVTWSPVASAVEVLIYGDGTETQPTKTLVLQRDPNTPIWRGVVAGDLHNVPYQLRFTSYGKQRTVADIHCKAALAGSRFSVAVDLERTNPEGWADHQPPRLAQPTDEVIYEIHVRDFSMTDPNCPPEYKGKYPGLTTPGNVEPGEDGIATGIAHLKHLGVTAVHLLPIHDFGGERHEYNWGYWTTLFNVVESDYSTTPQDPANTIREFKQTIQTLHENDIRVILDVVYNHTSSSGEYSAFDQTVPNYFFRTNPDGSLRNDAGVGNSVADERLMVRKYIVDSLKYWVTEYKIDGVRFDLLGTHHPETMREIVKELHGLRPDLTIYGEPWTGGGPTYFPKGAQRGLGLAVFNDHHRNAIRGDLDGRATGFATGAGGDIASIRNGIAGGIDDFTDAPIETINYVSAHDNRTLWDKLEFTHPQATDAEKRAMHKLALGIVLTSQGIPFLHGGVDLARTKGGDHNSYNKGDQVNAFGWDRKAEYRDIHDYVAGLIALRRAHPAFRFTKKQQIRENLSFVKNTPEGVVAYLLDGRGVGDSWDSIMVAYNGQPSAKKVKLLGGVWSVVVNAESAGNRSLGEARGEIELPPYSMVVLHQ